MLVHLVKVSKVVFQMMNVKSDYQKILFVVILGLVIIGANVSQIFAQVPSQPTIPIWIKNNAKWWSEGQLGDSDFEKGIEYLIDQKIINIPPQNQTTLVAQQIPAWVKSTAGMWANGQISDSDFLRGIQYLAQIGIIQVHIDNTAVTVTPTPPITSSANTILGNSETQLNNTQSTSVSQSTQPTTSETSIQPSPNKTSTVLTVPITTNTTKLSNTSPTVTPTANPIKSNVDSLVGNGVSLKINGNVASGTLIIAGIRYNAPSLLISEQGNQIQLQGNLQTSDTSMLEVVGMPTSGNEYNFYGVISDNGKSTPVTFTALLNEGTNQASTTSNQPTSVAPNKVQMLPMLMLYAQSDEVYMGYPYDLAVKIFDPKTNPQKIFDQSLGGIPGVTINGTILDPNNATFASFSGKTDNNGLYQYQVQTTYYKGWQEIFKVLVNATKSGYAQQFATMSFVTLYPNQGGSQHCSSTIPIAPTDLSATAVPPTQVNLSWTASTGATGYNILRGITSTGESSTPVGTTTGTTFSDTGLTQGKTYYYVIQATNCAGKSSNSNEVPKMP